MKSCICVKNIGGPETGTSQTVTIFWVQLGMNTLSEVCTRQKWKGTRYQVPPKDTKWSAIKSNSKLNPLSNLHWHSTVHHVSKHVSLVRLRHQHSSHGPHTCRSGMATSLPSQTHSLGQGHLIHTLQIHLIWCASCWLMRQFEGVCGQQPCAHSIRVWGFGSGKGKEKIWIG
jgi:hypothetical protein